MRYPFVIRNKSVIVEAKSFDNALDRVLYRNPNKFITTTYAKNVAKHQKNMDLINAQKQAKALSKTKKGELIYVLLEADEFIIKNFMEVKEKDDVYSVWRDGAKYEDPKEDVKAEMKVSKKLSPASPPVAEKNVSKKITNKTENKMETKTKSPKKAKKIAAKKKVAKKLTPKTARKFDAGKVVAISIADMLKNMRKGFYYRDPQGVRQTEAYMKTRAKQDYVREGMHEYKEAK